MIKNISQGRKDYERAYRWTRRFGEELLFNNPFFPKDEIDECALISYDECKSQFSGWINRQRYARWASRMAEPNMPWELPF